MSCRLCECPAPHTPFCHEHTSGWIRSLERQGVDFTSDASYYAAVAAYLQRIQIVSSGTESPLPPDAPSSQTSTSQEE